MRKVNAITAATACAFIALAGVSGSASAQAPAGTTVFEGARIITGEGNTVIDNGSIVVQGGKIVRIGRGADVSVPAGATRVNLAGKTVMPAIIDTHVHLSQTRDGVVQDLRRRLYYGVTAAQSMGTDSGELLPMRNETIAGGARYLSAGRGITRPEPGRPNVPYWVNTEQEARNAVKELAARNVDVVKIWVDDRNGMYPKLTPELYGAIIDEAHKNGLRVTAHIFTLDDAKGLLRAGVDAFAHSVRDRDVDDEFMMLVRQRPNLVVNPNLPDRGARTDVTWLRASLPAADYQRIEMENVDDARAQMAHGIQARNLAKLVAADVEVVVGTDGNTPWQPHVEMEDMALAGMTPIQVIHAATRDAAQFMRLHDAGTLTPGKNADLLVLDANPLDDIKNTRRISAVYLHGAAVDRSRAP